MILTTHNQRNEDYRKLIYSIIKRDFILEKHFENLEKNIKGKKMIIAFRAAGNFTLEKLRAGAAAKPHSILAKTIKPEELGVKDMSNFSYGKAHLLYDADEMFKYLLCGLVGVRNNRGINGLYLSSKGKKMVESMTIQVISSKKNDTMYVVFSGLKGLLEWLRTLYYNLFCESITITITNVMKLSEYFITGDYDIHEIHIKDQKDRNYKNRNYKNIKSGTIEEIEVLYMLSHAVENTKMEVGSKKEYIPNETNPIQHGAQANYLDFMLENEPHEKLVTKVMLPDTNIAIYYAEQNEWSIVCNTPKNYLLYELEALQRQSIEINRVLEQYGAKITYKWNFEEIKVQIMIMEMQGKSAAECRDYILEMSRENEKN